MSPSDTLNLSFSVLDGDEPKHWTIWTLGFTAVDQMVRAIEGQIHPYPTRSEFYLLDQTAEQLYQRDSWMNVIGTIIHITDEAHLQRLRSVHGRLCHYLKRQPDALYKEVGYYILPVAEPPVLKDRHLADCTVDFLKDARFALGPKVAEFARSASSEHDLKNSLQFVARRIVLLREVASDR